MSGPEMSPNHADCGYSVDDAVIPNDPKSKYVFCDGLQINPYETILGIFANHKHDKQQNSWNTSGAYSTKLFIS